LTSYEKPYIDPAIEKELREFIQKRKGELHPNKNCIDKPVQNFNLKRETIK